MGQRFRGIKRSDVRIGDCRRFNKESFPCRRMRAILLVVLLLASVQGQFQPEWDPSNYLERTEVAEAGNAGAGERVLRFVQVSDAHILDDDAPYPMRQELLDPFITAFSTSAQRPHEEFTDEVLNAVIIEINELHASDAFSFVLNTGDNIDNQQENELMRFIDNWEGTHSTKGPLSGLECAPDGPYAPLDDTSNDVTDQCTSLPPELATNNTPLASDLPWFSAFGNHDGMVQGNAPIEPGFQEIAGESGRFLLEQPAFVAMHFENSRACNNGAPLGSPNDDMGHGFGFAGDRLCDESPDNDGYYSFAEAGVRFIVLDTLNDDFVSANENLQGVFNPQSSAGYDVIGGYAEGALDPEQFAWLQLEIAANQDEIIIIAAHHTVNSMFTNPAEDYCASGVGCLADLLVASGFVTGTELTAYLNGQPNVVAFIGGHTHQHLIEDKSTFWNIETSSLIDRPQESRTIEVWQEGDKGFLRLDRFGHDYQLSKDYLALDDQQKAEQDGEEKDRDVLLWFEIPPSVVLEPQPELPRNYELSFTSTAELGPATLALTVLDALSGLPVTGLDVSSDLVYGTGTSAEQVLAVGTELVETANGYEVDVTLTAAKTHYATASITDPAGVYPDASKTFSVQVSVNQQADAKETPMPFAIMLLALALAIRQKR